MESQVNRRIAASVRPSLSFDPRTQLLLVLIAGTACAMLSVSGVLILTGMLIGYVWLQGFGRAALGFTVAAFLAVESYSFSLSTNVEILDFLAFMLALLVRLLPVTLAAYPLGFVPAGKLMASLQRLGLPRNLLISLTVSLRFLPMLRLEYEAVRTSARLRGLSANRLSNWRHPLRMFEYRMVPLLMRSLKIADELAASAAVRGIEAPGQRTSVYPISLRLQDYAAVLVFGVTVSVLLL